MQQLFETVSKKAIEHMLNNPLPKPLVLTGDSKKLMGLAAENIRTIATNDSCSAKNGSIDSDPSSRRLDLWAERRIAYEVSEFVQLILKNLNN